MKSIFAEKQTLLVPGYARSNLDFDFQVTGELIRAKLLRGILAKM